MRRSALLLTLVAGIATVQIGRAQTTPAGPWFGVKPPGGVGDPHRPVVDVAKAVPCFNVGAADGAFLETVMTRAAAANREVRMQLRGSTSMAECRPVARNGSSQ